MAYGGIFYAIVSAAALGLELVADSAARIVEAGLAVRKAATSGSSQFFLGTDSAPHSRSAKESACGCAGIFNAPYALESYAQVFEAEGALDRFEAFALPKSPLVTNVTPLGN